MRPIFQRLLIVVGLILGLATNAMSQTLGLSGDTTLLPYYEDTTIVAIDSVAIDSATIDSTAFDFSASATDLMLRVEREEPSAPDLSVMQIYREKVTKQNCFFVVSKAELILSVYEVVGIDTLLAATFPICYGRNKGDKTKNGDGCTPECSMAKPFYILEIKDAHTWRHDFKDGRGSILAYGYWFMRLDLSRSDCNPNVRSNRSIGIHGSTNNAKSVPGQGSEGCIRLRDADLLVLHDRYAQPGQKVIVFPINHKKLSFER